MDLNQLYPFAGDHAVQNAVFAITWDGLLTPEELARIDGEIRPKLAKDFPKVNEQMGFMLQFNMGQGGSPQPGSPILGGYIYGKTEGVSPQSIQLSKEQFLVNVTDYNGWTQVWKAVSGYLSSILPAILKVKSITTVGLQYSDLFTWKAAPANLELNKVFREGTEYLAAHAFKAKNLWHCHHGFFTDTNAYRRLDNVNVNVNDVEGFRTIQIVTSHQAALIGNIFSTTEGYDKRVADIYSESHSFNTDILRDLLHADVCKRIGLEPK